MPRPATTPPSQELSVPVEAGLMNAPYSGAERLRRRRHRTSRFVGQMSENELVTRKAEEVSQQQAARDLRAREEAQSREELYARMKTAAVEARRAEREAQFTEEYHIPWGELAVAQAREEELREQYTERQTTKRTRVYIRQDRDTSRIRRRSLKQAKTTEESPENSFLSSHYFLTSPSLEDIFTSPQSSVDGLDGASQTVQENNDTISTMFDYVKSHDEHSTVPSRPEKDQEMQIQQDERSELSDTAQASASTAGDTQHRFLDAIKTSEASFGTHKSTHSSLGRHDFQHVDSSSDGVGMGQEETAASLRSHSLDPPKNRSSPLRFTNSAGAQDVEDSSAEVSTKSGAGKSPEPSGDSLMTVIPGLELSAEGSSATQGKDDPPIGIQPRQLRSMSFELSEVIRLGNEDRAEKEPVSKASVLGGHLQHKDDIAAEVDETIANVSRRANPPEYSSQSTAAVPPQYDVVVPSGGNALADYFARLAEETSEEDGRDDRSLIGLPLRPAGRVPRSMDSSRSLDIVPDVQRPDHYKVDKVHGSGPQALIHASVEGEQQDQPDLEVDEPPLGELVSWLKWSEVVKTTADRMSKPLFEAAWHRIYLKLREGGKEQMFAQLVIPGQVHWHRPPTAHWVDVIKCGLESYSGEEWIWRPFTRPSKLPFSARPTEGSVRCTWTEKSGYVRFEDLPIDIASRLSVLWNHLTKHKLKVHIVVDHGGTANESSSAPSLSTPTSSDPSPPVHNGRPSQQGLSAIPTKVNITLVDRNLSNRSPNIVSPAVLSNLVCIPRSRALVPVVIDLDATEGDADFFHKFNTEVRRVRSWWRYCLGPWQFAFCHASRFEKYRVEKLGFVCHEMPHDPDYVYDPKPAPLPYVMPLTAGEWEERFYDHPNDTDHPGTGGSASGFRDAVLKLPMRTSRFQLSLHTKREELWGLSVQLRISAVIVMMWQLVILVLGTVFTIWWLARHPGDLQNAAVPFTMMIGASALLWLPLSEKVKDAYW